MADIIIREAEASDCKILASLMLDSAKEQRITTDSAIMAGDLERDGFGSSSIFTFIVSSTQEGQAVGYLLSYYGYSTMVGRSVFAEDIFVVPSYRRKGIASALWKRFSQMAIDQNCCRCDIYTKAPNNFLRNRGAVDFSESSDYLFFKMDRDTMERYVQNYKSSEGVEVRRAKQSDCAGIKEVIQGLYDYLNNSAAMKIDAAVLEKDGFGDRPYYTSYVAEKDGVIVGYSLLFFTYHFDGFGVFMEDIYVSPEYRGKGIGVELWGKLIKEGLAKGGKRCSFNVAASNVPSINFYKHKGAVDMTCTEGFHYYKLSKDALEKCART